MNNIIQKILNDKEIKEQMKKIAQLKALEEISSSLSLRELMLLDAVISSDNEEDDNDDHDCHLSPEDGCEHPSHYQLE
jgi:hypothetical protein